MSSWTYISGVIEVSPRGRTKAEISSLYCWGKDERHSYLLERNFFLAKNN